MEIPQNYLEKFGKSKERKPATQRIWDIEQIARLTNQKWLCIWAKTKLFTDIEIHELLDKAQGKDQVAKQKALWYFLKKKNEEIKTKIKQAKEATEMEKRSDRVPEEMRP